MYGTLAFDDATAVAAEEAPWENIGSDSMTAAAPELAYCGEWLLSRLTQELPQMHALKVYAVSPDVTEHDATFELTIRLWQTTVSGHVECVDALWDRHVVADIPHKVKSTIIGRISDVGRRLPLLD